MSEYEDIKDGFNAGYVMRKYEPELTEKLSVSYASAEGDFFKAFVAGTKEYERELIDKAKKRFPNLDSLPYVENPEPDNSRSKDEPEIDI